MNFEHHKLTGFGKMCIVHISDFAYLEISYKPQGIVYRIETFKNDKGIEVLQSLKGSLLSTISNLFCEPPKLDV